MGLFEYIHQKIDEALSSRRIGFFVGAVSNALRDFRRTDVDAEWGPTLERARRIASPVVDVIPAVGTRMAVLSQDGVPEFPAVVGQIWDDMADEMTAWLRANLEQHPGHIELGADKGLRIIVGEHRTELEPTNNGEMVIESDDGSNAITLKPNGTVEIDADQINLAGSAGKLARADKVKTELDRIWTELNAHTHPGKPASQPSETTGPSSTTGAATGVKSGSVSSD